MTILEFLSEPNRLEAYQKWLADPMTQEMKRMSQEFSKPVGINPITGESALYNLGLFVGSATKHDFIFESLKIIEDAARQAATEALVPDYGYLNMLPPAVREALKKKQGESK